MSGSAAAERIASAFSDNGKTAALMPYLMGGYPSPEVSVEAALACADSGADLLELGIPFSDPLADGPTIHAAGTAALADGVTPLAVLRVCEQVAAAIPVVFMVYANIATGDGFVERAAAAGAVGLIVPDLPHDEAGPLREACDASGLSLVPLAAPTTTDERLGEIAAGARGFVYTVSLTGTTGERNELPAGLANTVARVRSAASVPVAVGFGISTPDHARAVAEVADGVIVGSRVVRASGEGGAEAVGELVAGLAGALTP